MSYTVVPSNPFTVPGTAAGFLDIRKKASANGGVAGPVITVPVPYLTSGAVWNMGLIIGQSNDSGLAPFADWPAARFGSAFPLTPIWNDDTNAFEPLLLGSNECGLNGNAGYPDPPNGYPYVRSDGVTIPGGLAGYYDGAGAEMEWAYRWKLDHATDGAKFYLLKQNVNHPTNTNNATIQRWEDEILASLAQQNQRTTAAAAAAGATINVPWIHFGVKESVMDGDDYSAQMLQLRQNFIAQGIGTAATKWYLPLAPQASAAGARAKQQQLAADHPDIFTAYSFTTGYLPDNVHFNQPGQVNQGNALYNLANNTTTPPDNGSGGDGGIGTFALRSGTNGNQRLAAIATGSAATIANGFTAFAKVTPEVLGGGNQDPQYIISLGDLGGDESSSFYFAADATARLRIKLASGYVSPERTLSGLTTAANSTYRVVMVGYEQSGTAYLTMYINGTAYPFSFAGSFNRNTAPAVFGGITVNGSASAFPQNILGVLSQMGFINRAYSASEVAALDAADLVLTQAQYEAAEVAIYAPGPTQTATSLSTANLADTAHPLTVDRH